MPLKLSSIRFPMPGLAMTFLISVAVILVWILVSDSHSPNRTIAELSSAGSVERTQAVEALVQRGMGGVTELIAALEGDNRRSRLSALIGLGQMGPVAFDAIESVRTALHDNDPDIRATAIPTYWRICRTPQKVISDIIVMLKDSNEDVRLASARTLEAIGQIDSNSFLELVRSDSFDVHDAAWAILRQVWKEDLRRVERRDVVKNVRDLIDHSDSKVRKDGIWTLVTWQIASPSEIRELIHFEESNQASTYSINDSELTPTDSCLAAIAALEYESEAAELLPEVIVLLEQQTSLGTSRVIRGNGSGRDTRVFTMTPRFELILSALSSMKTKARTAVFALAKRLSELHGSSQVPVAQTLVDIGCDPDIVIPVLIPLLTDHADVFSLELKSRRWRNHEVAMHAAMVLSQASPEQARRQTIELMPKLRGADGDVNRVILFALSGLGSSASEAVPAIAPLVLHMDNEIRWQAVAALANIGSSAAPAVPRLVLQLERSSSEKDSEMTERVIEALGRIGPSAKVSVSTLLSVIHRPGDFLSDVGLPTLAKYGLDPSVKLKLMAIASLGGIGDGDSRAAECLRELTNEPSLLIRLTAINSLGRLNRNSDQILFGLVSLLRDESKAVRSQAAMAIGALNGNRQFALSALEEALSDESVNVRAAAVVALGRIGHDAISVLSALQEMSSIDVDIEPLRRRSRIVWMGSMPWFDPTPVFKHQNLRHLVRDAISAIEDSRE